MPASSLPPAVYAEVAPLPVPMANHLFMRYQSCSQHDEALQAFLSELHDKRGHIFLYMDPYVRNRHQQAADFLRFGAAWVRQTVGIYTAERRDIPASTYTDWIRRGIVRLERKGKPLPDSAAALCIARMIDHRERHFLPEVLDEQEPLWWCYAQETRQSEILVIPITHIHQLRPSSLLWTSWAGAAWERGWFIIGENEQYIGAIRFAGTTTVRSQSYWDVTLHDLVGWDERAAELYVPFPGAAFSQIQALAQTILLRLARPRFKLLYGVKRDEHFLSTYAQTLLKV